MNSYGDDTEREQIARRRRIRRNLHLFRRHGQRKQFPLPGGTPFYDARPVKICKRSENKNQRKELNEGI
jgi:hypothetical protein